MICVEVGKCPVCQSGLYDNCSGTAKSVVDLIDPYTTAGDALGIEKVMAGLEQDRYSRIRIRTSRKSGGCSDGA